MKRFLCYMLVLGLVASVFVAANDILIHSMVTASSGNSAYKMQRLFAPAVEGEVPILGSSRAKENFVPSMISPSCFDYGENGQSFAETLFHLQHVLKSPGRDTVIVNLDPWGPHGVDVRFMCDYRFAHNVPNDPRLPSCRWADRLPGLRFAGQLRGTFATWMNERKSTTRVVDHGAMLLQYERTEEEIAKAEAGLSDQGFECSEDMREALRKVLSDVPSEKRIVWVVAPVSAGWERHFTGQRELTDFLNWLSQFPRCKTIDCRIGQVDLTARDFKDCTHLNYAGAKKFTSHLAKCLRETILPGGTK